MKKLLPLFGFLTFLLISCSSDDNTPSEESVVLPKTISYLYPNASLGTNSTSTLKFDGKKIINSIDSDSKTIFTYNADLITKQELFNVDEKGNETKSKEVVYSYENGKLKTRIHKILFSKEYPDGEYIIKTVYTHNSNEQISYINYSIDAKTKLEIQTSIGTLTYKDGNLVKEQQTFKSVTTTLVFEYDTKNNPLKSILGFNLLLNEVSYFGKNNILKVIKASSENTNVSTYLTTYSYNENGYPLKHTSFDGTGKSIEYEIEYTY
ncbi:hypothetical protein [Flavobacterium sp. CSZ]|uniref:hypothetical protein n=1 Tax=Flavobacterium sp. CSZ TaxID=2783791 RepID=UPI00188C6581|nr:hypothetical protein [Flavobacterium sp. CSZ]MBF4486755.1 hypothetical protein [Flavobacterium sp. CSZ]